MATLDTNTNDLRTQASRLFLRKRLIAFGLPALILVYLTYIFFAFDIPGLVQKANGDNARTLISDTYSHKVHITRDNRNGEVTAAIEGEKKGAIQRAQHRIGSSWANTPLSIWGTVTSSPTVQKPSHMTCLATD